MNIQFFFFKNFLILDEKDKNNYEVLNNVKISKINVNNDETIIDNDCRKDHNTCEFSIIISNATAKWTPNQPNNIINNINLDVKPGQVIAIIGTVGAGKVSL